MPNALARREQIKGSRLDIYSSAADHPELVYEKAELEALLSDELRGRTFAGQNRTRGKLAKQAICEVLGYPVPSRMRRVVPRLPGQDLEVAVQKSLNFQPWNTSITPTRRYAFVGVDGEGVVNSVLVLDGTELQVFDPTGTVTTKFQARRLPGHTGSRVVSPVDTPAFVEALAPVDTADVSARSPTAAPRSGEVLSIDALQKRLTALVGRSFPWSTSQRDQGEQLHRLACEALGFSSYADTGRFPDIINQALEVKLQTSPTIDLGLVDPASEEPASAVDPGLRHRDCRYLVAYGHVEDERVQITEIVVSTGADFFTEFRRFGGLGKNQKLQLRLPADFFA